MATTFPSIDKLLPTWDFAVTAGVSEKELRKSLRDDGIRIIELSVGTKHVFFVNRDDVDEYIARHARVSSASNMTLSERFEELIQEFARLKEKTESFSNDLNNKEQGQNK